MEPGLKSRPSSYRAHAVSSHTVLLPFILLKCLGCANALDILSDETEVLEREIEDEGKGW